MKQYLTIEQGELEAQKSYWTAKEIYQQPRVWREAEAAVEQQREAIDAWLTPILEKKALRIIMSGAGTSAFIGDTLAAWLSKKLNRRVDAVSTTDLVGDPQQILAEDLPTLMVSFARSGNSPESVAGVKLVDQVLSESYHLVLTCNPDGQLARESSNNAKALCLIMPEGCNDRSFAMTSSYSSMLVSCATIFTPNARQLALASAAVEQLIESKAEQIKSLAARDFSRLVVLGAGCLYGTAKEASLKSLELSAGKVVPMCDTPLGFRHGPKSVIDQQTIVIHMQSADAHVKLYDIDLLNEIRRDNQAMAIVTLSPETMGLTDGELDAIWLSLPYIVYCQMLAFFKSLALNISADNPCPSGEVNRVVQGVTIHGYASSA